jgi:hypothetical protein
MEHSRKICERFCIFPSEAFGQNFNISKNSIISVEAAKVQQSLAHLAAFD